MDMLLATDITVSSTPLHLLPVETRVPLKFCAETLTRVTCARARVQVRRRGGHAAEGWGETPLSVQWVWPSPLSYAIRGNRSQPPARRRGNLTKANLSAKTPASLLRL